MQISTPDRRALGAKLYLLGFLTLFLELVLIRYLAGNIWNLGYFPNFVLIAAFVGMGVGFVAHGRVSNEASPALFHGAAVLLGMLALLVRFLHPALPGFEAYQANFGGDLYFTAAPAAGSASAPLFGLWFLMVVSIFGLVAQRTAKVFRQFSPLHAYTLDIAGSCSGILAFMAMSWFQFGAPVWLGAVLVLFLLASERMASRSALAAVTGVAAALAVAAGQDAVATTGAEAAVVRWSPYQKVECVLEQGVYRVLVNGIRHQAMLSAENVRTNLPYAGPYILHGMNPELPAYRRVLILGAGTGNDVAAALASGAEHVDAVEIDPVIAELGKRYHPAHPYDDPRVTLVVDDGRAILTRSRQKYDLIVFALTDSLVKVSPMAQLRLENYLFTVESIRRANELLSDDGDLVLYNYYRQAWVQTKLEGMIQEATGRQPLLVFKIKDFAILAAGKHHHAEAADTVSTDPVDLARDDWPFLYLKRRGIPEIYLGVIGGLAAILAGLFRWLRRPSTQGPAADPWTKAAFALMGTAFLLLESKSVIQFSLLFGTTWLNNSLVFLGVLVLVLAANWAAYRMRAPHLALIFLPLVATSLLTIVIPLGRLLVIESTVLRFVCASLMTFSPIFFANLLFSVAFRDQALPEQVFGWNLLGATFGALLEYASLYLGYNALSVIVALCYTAAFGSLLASRSRALGVAPPVLASSDTGG